jgi:hypothetical protein
MKGIIILFACGLWPAWCAAFFLLQLLVVWQRVQSTTRPENKTKGKSSKAWLDSIFLCSPLVTATSLH